MWRNLEKTKSQPVGNGVEKCKKGLKVVDFGLGWTWFCHVNWHCVTAVHVHRPKKKNGWERPRQEWPDRTYVACEKESPSQQVHCSVTLDSGCWTLPKSTAESKIQGPERWGNKPQKKQKCKCIPTNCRRLPRMECEHRTLASPWFPVQKVGFGASFGDFLGSNFWTSSAVSKVEKKNLENRPFVFDHYAPKSTEGWWNRNEVCMLHVCMATWCPRGRWLLQNASKKLHSMVSTSCSGVRKFWDPPPREVPP